MHYIVYTYLYIYILVYIDYWVNRFNHLVSVDLTLLTWQVVENPDMAGDMSTFGDRVPERRFEADTWFRYRRP